MHNTFQNDLLKLRYKTVDTYSKMLKLGNAPQNYNTNSKVKLSASLQGHGHNLKIITIDDNVGEDIIVGVDMLLDYDKNNFNFDKDYIQVKLKLILLLLLLKKLGLIAPNIPITYSLKFRNISENGNSGTIKILLNEKSHSVPLISSIIKVPISDLEIF